MVRQVLLLLGGIAASNAGSVGGSPFARSEGVGGAATLWGAFPAKQTWDYASFSLTTGQPLATSSCGKDCRGAQQQQRQSAVDREAGVMYTIMCKQGLLGSKVTVRGFDLAEAKQTMAVEVPFTLFSGGFGAGTFGVAVDTSSSSPSVLAIGPTGKPPTGDRAHAPSVRSGGGWAHALYRVDPSTKTAALIKDGLVLLEPTAPSTTFDPASKILYVMTSSIEEGAQAVVGISSITGEQTSYTFTEMYTIDFHKGLLIGLQLAFKMDGQFRQLVGLDPASNRTRLVANLTEWESNLPATAIDLDSNTLVTMLLPQGSNTGHLVALDLSAGGNVTSAPVMCAEYDQCPWSIVFA